MELCQIHSIPIQKGQGSYGIGMGLIHIFPIPDYGKSMELCQIRSNPVVKDNRIKTE